MLMRLPKLLSDENLALVDEMIASGDFVDGSSTTGGPTKSAKNNLQLDMTKHAQREDFMAMISGIVNNHPAIRTTLLPKRMTVPLISKYQPGMAYGWHIDNPIMPSVGGPVRTDLACTIFLSNSDSYQGGELLVNGSSGEVRIKLERGDAFIYPATLRHQVNEVSGGERLAIVFWIQSVVGDQSQREILYDLELAYQQTYKENPTSEALQLIQRAQANLVRRWSDI